MLAQSNVIALQKKRKRRNLSARPFVKLKGVLTILLYIAPPPLVRHNAILLRDGAQIFPPDSANGTLSISQQLTQVLTSEENSSQQDAVQIFSPNNPVSPPLPPPSFSPFLPGR